MKLTKGSQPSWLFKILEAEHDMASALFCMQWAVEDEDFKGAMFHHFDYLYHRDRYDELANVENSAKKYWDFMYQVWGI